MMRPVRERRQGAGRRRDNQTATGRAIEALLDRGGRGRQLERGFRRVDL